VGNSTPLKIAKFKYSFINNLFKMNMLRNWFKSDKGLEKEGVSLFLKFKKDQKSLKELKDELKNGVKHGVDIETIVSELKHILTLLREEHSILMTEAGDYLKLERSFEKKIDELGNLIENELVPGRKSSREANVFIGSFWAFVAKHKQDLGKVERLANYERKGKTGGLFKWSWFSDNKLIRKGIRAVKKLKVDDNKFFKLKKKLDEAIHTKQLLSVKLDILKKIYIIIKEEHDLLMTEAGSYLNLEHNFEVNYEELITLIEEQDKIYGKTSRSIGVVKEDYLGFKSKCHSDLLSVKKYFSLERKAA